MEMMAHKRKLEELQQGGKGGFMPMKVCTFFLQGRCQKGAACTFAHTQDQLQPHAPEAQDEGLMQGLMERQMEAGNVKPSISAEDAFFESLQRDLNSATGGVRCSSSLEGPREFPPNALPKRLCSLWIRHPALCEQGDECLNAHGLMEMGLDVSTAVRLTTTNDETPVRVEVVNSALAGGPAKGCQKGCDKGGQGKAAAAFKGYGGEKGFKGKDGKVPLGLTRFPSGGFQPARLCQFWVTDPSACTSGDACSFAHGVPELAPQAVANCGISRFHHTGFAPKQICNFFQEGRCSKDLACTYAHSNEELVP